MGLLRLLEPSEPSDKLWYQEQVLGTPDPGAGAQGRRADDGPQLTGQDDAP